MIQKAFSIVKEKVSVPTLTTPKKDFREEKSWICREEQLISEKKRNGVKLITEKVKNTLENIVAFFLTITFIIPLWAFKISLKAMDFVEKLVRLYFWVMVKLIIWAVNLTYKALIMLGLGTPVRWLDKIARKYLKKYVSESKISDRQLSAQQKKQYQLLNVKKLEHKIRTPNIFIDHQKQIKQKPYQKSTQIERQIEKEMKKQLKQIQNLKESKDKGRYIPERQKLTEKTNITTSNVKQPTISNAQSSSRQKNKITGTVLPKQAVGLQEIKDFERGQKKHNNKKRLSPQKDIAHNQPLHLGTVSFKKQTESHEIVHDKLVLSSVPTFTLEQKMQLQSEIITLRKKMTDLINSNNHDIQELELWLKEKSDTVTNTRKENLQLLSQIQELQRQNIYKSKMFKELQKKAEEIQISLTEEKQMKATLVEKIQKLEQDVHQKTIQIMTLKQKINTNLIHIQQISTIFSVKTEIETQTKEYIRLESTQDSSYKSHNLQNQLAQQMIRQIIEEPKSSFNQIDHTTITTQQTNTEPLIMQRNQQTQNTAEEIVIIGVELQEEENSKDGEQKGKNQKKKRQNKKRK